MSNFFANELVAAIKVSQQCGAVVDLLMTIDLARLEEKVKMVESGHYLAAVMEMPGPEGFQMVQMSDPRIKYAAEECKMILFFAKQLREHHAANCPCKGQTPHP